MKTLLLLIAALALPASAATNAPPNTNAPVRGVLRPSVAPPLPTNPLARLYADPLWRYSTNQMALVRKRMEEVVARQNRENRDRTMAKRGGISPSQAQSRSWSNQRQQEHLQIEQMWREFNQHLYRLEARAKLYGTNLPSWLVDSEGRYVGSVDRPRSLALPQ